jgi:glutathionyl-hydroquinone reductase
MPRIAMNVLRYPNEIYRSNFVGDKKLNTIVSNESSEIIRIESEFNDFAQKS